MDKDVKPDAMATQRADTIPDLIAALTESEAKYCLNAIYLAGKLTPHQMQQVIGLAHAMGIDDE